MTMYSIRADKMIVPPNSIDEIAWRKDHCEKFNAVTRNAGHGPLLFAIINALMDTSHTDRRIDFSPDGGGGFELLLVTDVIPSGWFDEVAESATSYEIAAEREW